MTKLHIDNGTGTTPWQSKVVTVVVQVPVTGTGSEGQFADAALSMLVGDTDVEYEVTSVSVHNWPHRAGTATLMVRRHVCGGGPGVTSPGRRRAHPSTGVRPLSACARSQTAVNPPNHPITVGATRSAPGTHGVTLPAEAASHERPARRNQP